MADKTYRICLTCPIRHYENCETCFGFGVLRVDSAENGYLPINASTAIEGKLSPYLWMACPECGSTIKGLPERLEINAA